MTNSIKEGITTFINHLDVENNRSLSWEHCFKAFETEKNRYIKLKFDCLSCQLGYV